LEIENNQLKSQSRSSMTVVSILEYFKRCALEKDDELYKARKNIYINIQKTQDDYSTFCQSKLKAQYALGEVIGMKVFNDDIKKWQNEFQEDPKKPSFLNNCTLQSYQTTCNHSIE